MLVKAVEVINFMVLVFHAVNAPKLKGNKFKSRRRGKKENLRVRDSTKRKANQDRNMKRKKPKHHQREYAKKRGKAYSKDTQLLDVPCFSNWSVESKAGFPLPPIGSFC